MTETDVVEEALRTYRRLAAALRYGGLLPHYRLANHALEEYRNRKRQEKRTEQPRLFGRGGDPL